MTHGKELAPPRADEAENALLGSILLDPERLAEARRLLHPRDFFQPQARAMFGHMVALDAAGAAVDHVGLLPRLRDDPLFGPDEAKRYIVEMARFTPSALHAARYAEQVRRAARARRVLETARTLIDAVAGGGDAREASCDALAELDALWNEAPPTAPQSVGQLLAEHPRLAEPVIEGLIRCGETANLIAPPKFGKSWLAYGLALSVATGANWLGRFRCRRGRVLLLDNELHPGTLAGRIPAVADALGIRLAEYEGWLDVLSLRGRLLDLHGIARLAEGFDQDQYQVVICDAWYRVLPSDVSENDNAQIMWLYNALDALAAKLRTAWINIHHASKGQQAEKGVTDVGAGAGSQSRAADSHLVLRAHEQPGCAVLEAAVRSFPPLEPLPLRWSFPVWLPDETLNPQALEGLRTRQERRQHGKDAEGMEQLLTALARGPATVRQLRGAAGIGRERCERLLDRLEASGEVAWSEAHVRGNACRQYRLNAPLGDVGRERGRVGVCVSP
jgi:hypothetical protein